MSAPPNQLEAALGGITLCACALYTYSGPFPAILFHGPLCAPRALSAFPDLLVSEPLKPGAVPTPSASPLWAHLTTMILCSATGSGLPAFVGCSLRYRFLQKASPPAPF
ncbi:hypothetical protein EDB85DRAFT_1252227 [Lactarius pseudohatsudake]|nr:hypothetical protein EDB85DRAFT_1252227 [Lactarius pseudohatsudake]